MKLEKIIPYLQILLYLQKNKDVELNAMVKNLGVNYQTAHTALKKWKKSGFITIQMKDKFVMGESKLNYNITKAGEKILEDTVDMLKNFYELISPPGKKYRFNRFVVDFGKMELHQDQKYAKTFKIVKREILPLLEKQINKH